MNHTGWPYEADNEWENTLQERWRLMAKRQLEEKELAMIPKHGPTRTEIIKDIFTPLLPLALLLGVFTVVAWIVWSW